MNYIYRCKPINYDNSFREGSKLGGSMATPVFSILSTTLLFLWFSLEKGHAYQVTQTQFHHLVQVTSLLPPAVCNPASSKGNEHESASLKVVHRHGPCSKLIQDKATVPNLTTILLRDQARVNSIQLRLSNSASQPTTTSLTSPDSKKTTLPAKPGSLVGAGNYIVTVGLGTPANQLSLIFDTGSDLTWTQCEPCAKYCHDQKDPIFNPSKSKSYTNITCTSPLCAELSSATGNSPGCSTTTCLYAIQYGDKSYSIGFFGKEKLTLTPTDYVDNFLFGCGQNNQGLFGGSAGLLGLGRDKLSIVSQTAQKYGKVFSYCLPPPSTSAGHLSFGKSKTSKTLKYTPLPINSKYPSFYFINMVGISVGGKKLSIPESVFSSGGTIIDSGTVITRLPPTAYAAMRTAFRQLMSKYPMVEALAILDTCYDLSKYDTVTIPKISFFFSGGAEVDVDLSGILYAGSTAQVCLAVAGNGDDNDVAIFGNVQQQTLDVVYDLAAGKLGFGAGGC